MFPDTQTSQCLARLFSRSGAVTLIKCLKGVAEPVLHVRSLEAPKREVFTHPGGFDGGASVVEESFQSIKSKQLVDVQSRNAFGII